MHLSQIGPGAQPPGFGQLALSICAYLSVTDSAFIQEPRNLSPAAQGFLQVNLVWSSGAEQQEQFPGQRLLPNRLRVQKRGAHCLLDLAKLYACRLSLDIPRLRQLAFENPRPLLFLAFVLLRRRDIRQLPCRLGNVYLVRRTQEDVGANEWALVPLFGMAQRQSKRTQYAARALKTFQVGPLGVEDIDQVRVKGIALEEMVLSGFTGLAGLFVEISNTLQRRDDVGAKCITIADGL